jgi:hypothetical protein
MIRYLGTLDNSALFSYGGQAIVVDTQLNIVTRADAFSTLSEEFADSFYEAPTPEALYLANNYFAVSDLRAVTAAGGRMYTIPGGAQAEAKKALAWRKEEKRGGTPVGLNTARTLAKGGQIGIEKIRHIAKYFPRHEVDKKGKGWKPGEDNFPSNGRIAWALWGGDAAWRWASAIVERENKAITAGAYGFVHQSDPMNPFKIAHELDENFGPEFIARVRLDGSGFDRLYKIEIDGTVCVWDDCCWDDLGNVDSDIWTYDRALDDPYDTVGKDHVIIDAGSALIIAGLLDRNPHIPVMMEDIDSEEANLMALGLMEEDVDFIDTASLVSAAAAKPAATEGGTDKDGNYTPEERSKLAQGQARNALGRFATVGQRVAIAGDTERGSGTITKMNSKAATVDVQLDSGKTVTVDTKVTQPLDSIRKASAAKKMVNMENQPLDTSGILAEPRTPFNSKKGQLPGTLPPLTDSEINKMMTSWNSWVAGQRASFKPMPGQKNPYAVVKNGKITTQKTK